MKLLRGGNVTVLAGESLKGRGACGDDIIMISPTDVLLIKWSCENVVGATSGGL
jgi:hypothetical protein